jgi:hypothetical protein
MLACTNIKFDGRALKPLEVYAHSVLMHI